MRGWKWVRGGAGRGGVLGCLHAWMRCLEEAYGDGTKRGQHPLVGATCRVNLGERACLLDQVDVRNFDFEEPRFGHFCQVSWGCLRTHPWYRPLFIVAWRPRTAHHLIRYGLALGFCAQLGEGGRWFWCGGGVGFFGVRESVWRRNGVCGLCLCLCLWAWGEMGAGLVVCVFWSPWCARAAVSVGGVAVLLVGWSLFGKERKGTSHCVRGCGPGPGRVSVYIRMPLGARPLRGEQRNE